MEIENDTQILEQKVVEKNDSDAMGSLMEKYRPRLLVVVQFRLDRRLKSRIDADDVLQEAFIEAATRLDDYRKCNDKMSFFLWLRFITMQKLIQLHRRHIGAQARDANREVAIFRSYSPKATSMVLAAQLLGKMTSPSHAAMRKENKHRIEKGLSEMDSIDREVLALRHFEQLTISESAQLLGINDSAAANRYFRAIRRLKKVMDRLGNNASGIFENF
jgi:RNA polymerase sigma-70 factor (ECF subfamily)